MSKIGYTTHAVEQFIARHAPEMSFAEARALLEDLGERATKMRDKTPLGQEQWRLSEPYERCILVIKLDRSSANKNSPVRVCVTVLPPRAPEGITGVSEEEMELLEESKEFRAYAKKIMGKRSND